MVLGRPSFSRNQKKKMVNENDTWMERNNSTVVNEHNQLYLMYRNVYPCWPLIISAVAINLVAMFGMVANFAVIWTTYHTKSLHGTANFLLALCSFFELLHQHGHLLFLYVAFSGQNFIPISLAVRCCTLSLFGLGGISVSMAFIGLDRLLCVLFPTFPRKVKPATYLALITLVCTCFSARNVLLAYDSSSQMPLLMITGTIGELYQNDYAREQFSFQNLVFYTITIVLYLTVGLVTSRRKTGPISSSSSTVEKVSRRVVRSLFIIILVNVLGYYICSAYFLFLVQYVMTKLGPINCWTITMLVGIFTVNVSAASNGPVLYLTSKEYKKAFCHEFGRLRCRFICPSLGTTNAAVAAGGAVVVQVQPNHHRRSTISRTILSGKQPIFTASSKTTPVVKQSF